MYKLVILPIAKQDVDEAATWYNSKQRDLGKRFIGQVRQTTRLIKHNPHIAATRYDDVRTAVLDVFPFMVHYSINEEQVTIIILAVLHTSRNPDIWKTSAEIPTR